MNAILLVVVGLLVLASIAGAATARKGGRNPAAAALDGALMFTDMVALAVSGVAGTVQTLVGLVIARAWNAERFRLVLRSWEGYAEAWRDHGRDWRLLFAGQEPRWALRDTEA